MEKICVFCKNFHMSDSFAEPDDDSYCPATVGCLKSLIPCMDQDFRTDEFREYILKAESCEFYENYKGIK